MCVCDPKHQNKAQSPKRYLEIPGEKRGILRKGNKGRYPINKPSGSEKSLKTYDPLWRLIK
jgi:hypothetical protein